MDSGETTGRPPRQEWTEKNVASVARIVSKDEIALRESQRICDALAREFWEKCFIGGIRENSADDNAKDADEAVAEWRKRFDPRALPPEPPE